MLSKAGALLGSYRQLWHILYSPINFVVKESPQVSGPSILKCWHVHVLLNVQTNPDYPNDLQTHPPANGFQIISSLHGHSLF